MRLPIPLMSLLVGASVPALAVTLSGKVMDRSGAGKAGVTVSFRGDSTTTGTDGTWSLSDVGSGISSHLSNGRQVTTGGGHLLVDEGHLRVSLLGYDLMGRPRSGSSANLLPSGTPSGISARAATSGIDTFQYLWNGKRFLRDTASASRSGIVAIFDTTANDSIIYGWLSDSRDTQLYRTVTIGTQTWMAQNLNYQVDSSWCYGNADSNCTKYGRLYQWAAAMGLSSSYNSVLWQGADSAQHQGVCPSDWHVPTDTEWGTLLAYAGADSARIRLSSTSYYMGTDAYGFSVLSAGDRYGGGAFSGLGHESYFWSSSEFDASVPLTRGFYYHDANVWRYIGYKPYGCSLRCIRN